MKTICIHIGRGKTGTTSIQRYLSQKRSELLDQGVHYLYSDDAGRGAGHQQFAKSFITTPPAYMVPALNPQGIRQQVFDEICASTSEVILLSSENLPMADLSQLHRFFAELPAAFDIKIILFARSQDELAESEYNQLVKLKQETSSFAAYANGKLDDCDFFALASRWESCFGVGSVLCQVYDGARNDVVGQFLSMVPQVNVDLLSGSEAPGRLNENSSLSLKALTAIRLLNGFELADRDTVYAEIASGCSGGDLPALFFDSETARTFRSRFADSNRAFTKRFLGYESHDLGGRRYSDERRDDLRNLIEELRLDRY